MAALCFIIVSKRLIISVYDFVVLGAGGIVVVCSSIISGGCLIISENFFPHFYI